MRVRKKIIPTEDVDLSPCPFCGERSDLCIIEDFEDEYYIHCECCNTIGPDGNSIESATIQWNKRESDGEELH